MLSNTCSKKVLILLSTYNGAQYIKEQLDSILSQTYNNFEILVRDDCSTDNTLSILEAYAVKIINSNENLGVKQSFSTLLEYAVENTDSSYFMFCDQDDIWESDKIERALLKIQGMEKEYGDIPLLVHTDLKVVDEKLNTIDESFMRFQSIEAKYNKLNNLLMQNTITGCTMMINRKLAELCLPIQNESIMHDAWLGLVASQFGKIGYLNSATIKYRQHTNNSVGAKAFNLENIVLNARKKQSLSHNAAQANAFLDTYRNKLDKATIEMLEDFSTIESKSFWQKRKILLKHKLLKQGFIRNVGLLVKI